MAQAVMETLEQLVQSVTRLCKETTVGAVLCAPPAGKPAGAAVAAEVDVPSEAAAEARVCGAVLQLLKGVCSVQHDHGLPKRQPAVHPGSEQQLFSYFSSVAGKFGITPTAASEPPLGTRSVADLASRLADVASKCCGDGGSKESVPDQVELRLGYGAMLLGKVGDGSGVCSLEHVLRQIAALCFLCMAALTCIQVLAHVYRRQSRSTADADETSLQYKIQQLCSLCEGIFFVWGDFSHGMMQLLQGAVDVRVGLVCSMSDAFTKAATDTLQAATTDQEPKIPANTQASFLVETLIKLGAVQLEVMRDAKRDGDKENVSAGASRPGAPTAPAGLDHFLQAVRMATNWCNATKSRRWSEPAHVQKVPLPRNGKCPVTGKIFRHEGPQQPLSTPCCEKPLSVEGLSRLAYEGRLSAFEHAEGCEFKGSPLPAALSAYHIHDTEFEAACEADSVELQEFSDWSSPSEPAPGESNCGAGQPPAVDNAVALGWSILWESPHLQRVVKRVKLPGVPIVSLKSEDWRYYMMLQDLDGVIDSCFDTHGVTGLLASSAPEAGPIFHGDLAVVVDSHGDAAVADAVVEGLVPASAEPLGLGHQEVSISGAAPGTIAAAADTGVDQIVPSSGDTIVPTLQTGEATPGPGMTADTLQRPAAAVEWMHADQSSEKAATTPGLVRRAEAAVPMTREVTAELPRDSSAHTGSLDDTSFTNLSALPQQGGLGQVRLGTAGKADYMSMSARTASESIEGNSSLTIRGLPSGTLEHFESADEGPVPNQKAQVAADNVLTTPPMASKGNDTGGARSMPYGTRPQDVEPSFEAGPAASSLKQVPDGMRAANSAASDKMDAASPPGRPDPGSGSITDKSPPASSGDGSAREVTAAMPQSTTTSSPRRRSSILQRIPGVNFDKVKPAAAQPSPRRSFVQRLNCLACGVVHDPPEATPISRRDVSSGVKFVPHDQVLPMHASADSMPGWPQQSLHAGSSEDSDATPKEFPSCLLQVPPPPRWMSRSPEFLPGMPHDTKRHVFEGPSPNPQLQDAADPSSPQDPDGSSGPNTPNNSEPEIELSSDDKEALEQALTWVYKRGETFQGYPLNTPPGPAGKDTLMQFEDREFEEGSTQYHTKVAIKFFLRPAGYRAERMVRTVMDAEASECVLRFAEQNPISLPDGRIYHAPPCVIMMRGQSMADLMPPNSTPMRDDEKLKALREVTHDIMKLHAAGYAHHNIKPSNILRFSQLASGQTWKLADFHCALKAGASASISGRFSSKYSAPEIIAAYYRRQTSVPALMASDIWSFGIVMYILLTEEQPFEGWPREDVKKAMLGRRQLPWKALSETARKRLDITHGLGDMVLRCLDLNAKHRPTATLLNQFWNPHAAASSRSVSELRVSSRSTRDTISSPMHTIVETE